MIGMFNGDSECLYALSRCNEATVAIGLLGESLMLLYQNGVIAIEFLVPLHWTEIGGA